MLIVIIYTVFNKVENGTADVAISQPSVSYVRYIAAGDVSMTYGSRSFLMVTGKPKEIPANWYKQNKTNNTMF